jgi:hypothetical protein
MNNWSEYLPTNGNLAVCPSMPDSIMATSNQFEVGGLQANALTGAISNILQVGGNLSDAIYLRIDGVNKRIIGFDGTRNRVIITPQGINAWDINGNVII